MISFRLYKLRRIWGMKLISVKLFLIPLGSIGIWVLYSNGQFGPSFTVANPRFSRGESQPFFLIFGGHMSFYGATDTTVFGLFVTSYSHLAEAYMVIPYYLAKFLLKTAWKWNNLDRRGGGHVTLAPPPWIRHCKFTSKNPSFLWWWTMMHHLLPWGTFEKTKQLKVLENFLSCDEYVFNLGQVILHQGKMIIQYFLIGHIIAFQLWLDCIGITVVY